MARHTHMHSHTDGLTRRHEAAFYPT